MTVKDLRYLVDNLDEYIHVPGGIERLKKTILNLAISGKLVPQDVSEGSGEELCQEIQSRKQKLIAGGKLKKQKPLPEITEDEIPFEIPANWKWVKLDKIANLVTDGTHHTPQYQDAGVPFLSIKDVSAGALNFATCRYISETEHAEINQRCNPERGDILFCRIGTLGRPVIVDTDKPFSIFVSLGLIKFDQSLIVPGYLKLYLEAPQTYKQYASIMAGGSHTNKLNLVSMKALITALPPIAEQKRVVEKVYAVFTLLDKLSEKYLSEQTERQKLVASSLVQLSRGNGDLALQNLSEIIRTKSDAAQLRKAILHLAVSGQLVPQDSSEGTGQELYDQIQAEKQKLIAGGKLKKQKPLPPITEDEIPFEIPKSWKWVQLGDITNYGTSDKAKPSNILDNTWVLELEDIEKVSSALLARVYGRKSSSDKNLFYKGDVLYSKLRPYLDKVLIADENGVCSSEILPLRTPSNLLNSEYLSTSLKSPYFINTVNELTYGVKMPRLGTDDGRKMPIPIPPLSEQSRIVRKTTQLLVLVTELEKYLEK
jgi:type I restriction enzyme S subunit